MKKYNETQIYLEGKQSEKDVFDWLSRNEQRIECFGEIHDIEVHEEKHIQVKGIDATLTTASGIFPIDVKEDGNLDWSPRIMFEVLEVSAEGREHPGWGLTAQSTHILFYHKVDRLLLPIELQDLRVAAALAEGDDHMGIKPLFRKRYGPEDGTPEGQTMYLWYPDKEYFNVNTTPYKMGEK